jgi:hypothetical protein
MKPNPLKRAKQRKAPSDRTLQRRLDTFLSSKPRGGQEVCRVFEYFKPAGDVILFGGVLRDLALGGTRVYPSDIDIVVRVADKEKFKALLTPLRAKRNRFGGYRFAVAKWNFDVWSFSDTWAFRAGLVEGCSVDDLLKTTFFDWDAIAYITHDKRLVFSERYFEKISRRVVDINLLENPNPLGAALRALRIFGSGKGQLTPRLARYAINTVRTAVQDSRDDTGAPISDWVQTATDRLEVRLRESGELPVSGEAYQMDISP